MSLPDLLKAYRDRHGLTQEALAERWAMSVHTVRGIEAGKPTTHQMALSSLLSELLTSQR